MGTVMATYTVTREQAAHNEALVRRVYEELGRTAPTGLTYTTFVQEDGVSFVHVASVETADGQNPLEKVEAFHAFLAGIGDRCVVPPAVRPLRLVGSYGLSRG